MMKLFARIVYDFYSLTIFTKSSITDILKGPKYGSVYLFSWLILTCGTKRFFIMSNTFFQLSLSVA